MQSSGQNQMAKDQFIILKADEIRFERDEHAGGIVMIKGEERLRVGIISRAFPLSNPRRWLLVRDEEGDEIGLIDDARHLDSHSRNIVREEVEKSYFLPDITNVIDIDEDLNVVTWEVDTNRGLRTFMVRSVRQNIRRIAGFGILIRDVDGNRYRIRDYRQLPPRAQQMVEEYI
jgi:hypothetical protein